jgi:hypothetical protein
LTDARKSAQVFFAFVKLANERFTISFIDINSLRQIVKFVGFFTCRTNEKNLDY